MAEQQEGLVFVIDGKDYPIADFGSFTMQERRVMYDLAGIVQEDFVREEDADDDEHEARVRRLTRHPGFMEALMHIAYARGNEGLKRDKVQSVIDRTNLAEAIEKWEDANTEDDAGPPVRTSEPEGSSPRSSLEKNAPSGNGSPNGLDEPAKTPASTGTTRSDTSPTSDPVTSDA